MFSRGKHRASQGACASHKRAATVLLVGFLLPLVVGCQTAPAPANKKSAHNPGTRSEVLPSPPGSAAPARRVEIPDQKGTEVLAYVLQQAGRTTAVATLNVRLKQLEGKGLPREEALSVIVHEKGLWPHGQFGTVRMLRDRLTCQVPVLVQLQDTPDRKTRYFALMEPGPATNVFRARLGSGEVVRFREADLWERWERVRFWMMTVAPPESACWELTALEHVSRLQFYDAAGLFEQADQDAAQALLLDGRNPEICVTLGVRERARGRPEAAEQLLRKALEGREDYVRAMNNLAYLLAEQGRDLSEAERLARAAAQREPTNPRVLDTVGYVLQVQQRWPEALPFYERAFQRSTHLPDAVRQEIGFHLARAYVQADKPESATYLLETMRKESPGLMLPSDLEGLSH